MRRHSKALHTIAIFPFLLVFALCLPYAHATPPLDFTLHTLGDSNGPTVLIIGGIQGDEPGGFNAASLLATRYTIANGTLLVVPNLNFTSIIKRSRGVHGDMNRKFAALRKTDPEYATIQKIKHIITREDVDIVLNLHDGSGFYRPHWEDKWHNPRRWGQSVIIDQSTLKNVRFGNLQEMGAKAVAAANSTLASTEHRYHLKNTHTRQGDKEMEKTLTYFAINHGKPAFGIEASKSFGTNYRAYYHLQVVESFLQQVGITAKRDFKLSPKGVHAAMNKDLSLAFHDKRVLLDLCDVRPSLNYVPLQRDAAKDFTTPQPLMTVIPEGNSYRIYYGNRRLTRLKPQFFQYDNSLSGVNLTVDGTDVFVPFGHIVPVSKTFTVAEHKGYRVNIIGFTREGASSENDIPVTRADIASRFSVDRSATTYRVEVYRDDKFSGMLLVRFGTHKTSVATSKPSTMTIASKGSK